MNPEPSKFIGELVIWMVIITIPIVIIPLPRNRPGGKIPLSRFLLSIFLGWLILSYLQFGYFQQMNIYNAIGRGDKHYDPVGTNAAILVTGWVPLLFSTLLVSLLTLIYDKLVWKSPDKME